MSDWVYNRAFEVALWATLSAMPHSWRMYEVFMSKFVKTNLVRWDKFLLPCNRTLKGR